MFRITEQHKKHAHLRIPTLACDDLLEVDFFALHASDPDHPWEYLFITDAYLLENAKGRCLPAVARDLAAGREIRLLVGGDIITRVHDTLSYVMGVKKNA